MAEDPGELEAAELHREFLLSALRAAQLRARAMVADLETIGVSLKGNLIGPETAARWIIQSNMLWIVGEIPQAITAVVPKGSAETEKGA